MRTVGGRHRGRALSGLGGGDTTARLRPTSDRVRESLFNLLAHGGYGTPPPPEGQRVLDLFAGTGALGLEALSRGATHATFVETGKTSLAILRENAALLGEGNTSRVLPRDATKPGENSGDPFGMVFLDPPYGRALGERALEAVLTGGWLAPDALIVWEENTALNPPSGLTLRDERRYGDTVISIFRRT